MFARAWRNVWKHWQCYAHAETVLCRDGPKSLPPGKLGLMKANKAVYAQKLLPLLKQNSSFGLTSCEVGMTLATHRNVRIGGLCNKAEGEEALQKVHQEQQWKPLYLMQGLFGSSVMCLCRALAMRQCKYGTERNSRRPYISDDSADADFSGQANDRRPDALLLGSLDAVQNVARITC